MLYVSEGKALKSWTYRNQLLEPCAYGHGFQDSGFRIKLKIKNKEK